MTAGRGSAVGPRSLGLLADQAHKELLGSGDGSGALYGIRTLEDLGWSLNWSTDHPRFARRQVLARAERSASRRLGRQLGFPTGFDLGETLGSAELMGSMDVALAALEPHVFPAAGWSRLPRSPYRDVPLAALTCWTAQRVIHLSPSRRRLLASLAGGVDLWLVFSRNQAAVLAEHLGIPEGRVRFVPFGIRVETMAPAMEVARGQRDEQGCPPAVLSVGKDLGRDYATLLHAAPAIRSQIRVATWPRNLPDGCVPPANVELVGHLAWLDYMAALGRADIVVIPTHPWAYPTGQSVLLQAWSAGCAVVTTDRRAIHDYVTDGEDALLVPPGDPGALAEAVNGLLEDPRKRRRLGDNGARRVRGQFTEQHMWEAVDTELRALIA